ncbi:MAG: hypothetical protein LBN39_07215 [Planctomycetaceae bacterium]|jgi:hypothetical protein|nr:hypothetical protein [Planctomycetaceae bacterium]
MITDESLNVSAEKTVHAAETVMLAEHEEYFDRERWHDVETESPSAEYVRKSNNQRYFSTLSAALLLLTTVLAGGGGVFTAYYLHSMSRFRLPLPQNAAYRDTLVHWTGYYEDGVLFFDVQEPTCFFTTHDNRFYIGEGHPVSLLEFSPRGELLRTIPLESKPAAVVFGSPGQLFEGKIVVSHLNSITVYSPDGKLELSWDMPNEKSAVFGLALSADSLYAADSGTKLVERFDGNGQLIQTIGEPTEGNKEKPADAAAFDGFAVYKAPMTLAVSPKTGLLHVANPGKHKIEVFTPDGHWEQALSWGYASSDPIGFSGCCNPTAVMILDDGRIVTAEKSVIRVKIYRTNRRLDCFVAGPETLDRKPLNVPQLSSFRLMAAHNDRCLSLGVVGGKEIVVFDPILRVVRFFQPQQREQQ